VDDRVPGADDPVEEVDLDLAEPDRGDDRAVDPVGVGNPESRSDHPGTIG
jgi:hypothetical protein